MLVLLSPSKTQDFETRSPHAAFTQPALLEQSVLLAKELKKLSAAKISELMDVSAKIAKLNHDRYQAFTTPFTKSNAKQALFAFQGDVYTGMDAKSLSEDAVTFAQEHLRILSGFYGVLRPLDLIQPYRLEMKIRLKNPRGKDLYAFWGDQLTEMLNEALQEHENKVVINLASEEYFKAINVEKLEARLVTPEFKEKKARGYQMIGLFAKKARGRMARYIMEHAIDVADALQFFSEDGYRLNVALSTPEKPVYTREKRSPPARAQKRS